MRSSTSCGWQLFANVIAGITIISNAVVILSDLSRLAPAQIGAPVRFVSVFNAVGRFFWVEYPTGIGCQRTLRSDVLGPGCDALAALGVHTPPRDLAASPSFFSAAVECSEHAVLQRAMLRHAVHGIELRLV